jgi:hypothetical protein
MNPEEEMAVRLKLSDKLARYIEKRAGLSIGEIRNQTTTETDAAIGRRYHKQIKVTPPRKAGLVGRGSVLLNRLSDSTAVEKKLQTIK